MTMLAVMSGGKLRLTTLATFARANDDPDSEELLAAVRALPVGATHRAGGGAEPPICIGNLGEIAVPLGFGVVDVGTRLRADGSVAITIGDNTGSENNVADLVRADPERAVFSLETRSLAAVRVLLGAVQRIHDRLLERTCRACAAPMETVGRLCRECASLRSDRMAEPRSVIAQEIFRRAFLAEHHAAQSLKTELEKLQDRCAHDSEFIREEAVNDICLNCGLTFQYCRACKAPHAAPMCSTAKTP